METLTTSALTPDAVALMERVVWGTEGARYTFVEIEPTLRHVPQAQYLTLSQNARLLGLRMILEKRARFGDQDLHCFYHSMFCVDPKEKGKGYGKKLAEETLRHLRARLGAKGLIYCHVEKDNKNSLTISESLGYQHVGNFSAMTFSRFFPKSSPRLKALPAEQKGRMVELLSEQYQGHALTDFQSSLRPESYFVLTQIGRFVAGLQADLQEWKIHSLAGAGGAVALHALPRIPLLRSLFNPQKFRFLKVGSIYFEKGHPEAAYELLEGVLAHHRLKTAMLFLDKESPIYNQIASAGRFGLLNALTETPVHVLARFHGFSPEEINDFRRKPKVISPDDI